MINKKTFGNIVSSFRKKKNLSQKELAQKIMREDGDPISPQYLNDIEHDRRSPSSDHIIKQFSKALGVKADYLHYLNGRFPEPERKRKLTSLEFERAIIAFRDNSKRQ